MLLLAGRVERPTALAWQSLTLGAARRLAILTLCSAVGVLAHQAALASGRAGALLEPAEWVRVLGSTHFGVVWSLHLALLALAATFVLLGDPRRPGGVADQAAFGIEAWLLALSALGALGWAGHAAAVEPWALAASLSHALHLAGAALWLGALPWLALLLRAGAREGGADSRPWAVIAARRVSRLALAVMIGLLATGLWNTWTHVGDFPSLVGTRYGLLLLGKLAVLALVLGLAAFNRRRLLPALSGPAAAVGRPAMARLARSVWGEWSLGLAMLALVAVLIGTPPGRHETPWWPLDWRLDYPVTIGLPGVRTRFLIGSQVALLGLLAMVVGLLLPRRRAAVAAAGAGVLVVGLWTALPPLAVDAYPTTYRRPAVTYQALSVARGRELFAAHCVRCHGAQGRGDGPDGVGLPRRPADLTAPHTNEHTAGDLFWWLTHGIPRGGMPGFAGALGEEERWDLINFLRALSAGTQARSLTPVVEPGRPRLVAPDFSFTVGPGPTLALKDFRGRRSVLLVFFDLPLSRERLDRLARAYQGLQGLGAEILAVPLDPAPGILARLGADPRILFPVITEGAAEIAATYDLFGQTLAGPGMASESPGASTEGRRPVEWLVDRNGYLRARWIPGEPGPGWEDPAALVNELQQLAREAPAPPPDEHVH
jgi:putative copper resistance protein D